MDSILVSIRTALGVDKDYGGFDNEIIIGINTAIMYLDQIGISPTIPVVVTDEQASWTELLEGTTLNMAAVKSYILLQAKMTFDPPGTSFVLGALKAQIEEAANRIMMQVESA